MKDQLDQRRGEERQEGTPPELSEVEQKGNSAYSLPKPGLGISLLWNVALQRYKNLIMIRIYGIPVIKTEILMRGLLSFWTMW